MRSRITGKPGSCRAGGVSTDGVPVGIGLFIRVLPLMAPPSCGAVAGRPHAGACDHRRGGKAGTCRRSVDGRRLGCGREVEEVLGVLLGWLGTEIGTDEAGVVTSACVECASRA